MLLAQLRDFALALVRDVLYCSRIGRRLALGEEALVEGSAGLHHVARRRLNSQLEHPHLTHHVVLPRPESAFGVRLDPGAEALTLGLRSWLVEKVLQALLIAL